MICGTGMWYKKWDDYINQIYVCSSYRFVQFKILHYSINMAHILTTTVQTSTEILLFHTNSYAVFQLVSMAFY